MDNPFDWEEEWEWEKENNISPISGQLSFFPADKNSFLKSSKEENNILSFSFEDIIYKNSAYTIGEIEHLKFLGDLMDEDLSPEIRKELRDA